jgi:hypothetical protein
MIPAQTPASPNTPVLLESTRSVLRRAALRAFSIGQIEAAVKWHAEAQAIEQAIEAMRTRKARQS